jgi:hypothetical protein
MNRQPIDPTAGERARRMRSSSEDRPIAAQPVVRLTDPVVLVTDPTAGERARAIGERPGGVHIVADPTDARASRLGAREPHGG